MKFRAKLLLKYWAREKQTMRCHNKIKKNLDRMAERSPDGLFTVLQAALNDLQTGMIESLSKVIK